jgi:hypothetical protein
VSDQPRLSKVELLAKIDESWQDFNAYLMTLNPIVVTTATDAAGWTILDHVVHIAVWEDGIDAVLNGQDRAGRMGIDQALLSSRDFDQINAVIQQQHKHLSLSEAQQFVMGVHQRFIAKIDSLADDDLYKPYRHYQPASDREAPVIDWIKADTYEHYAEHKLWITAIADSAKPMSKADILARIEKGWNGLNDYVQTLTETQLTAPTDAAGWTVKDHLMHLAVWEDGIVALLSGQDRAARMRLDAETWNSHDYDRMNAVIQQQHKDLSLSEVRQHFSAAHHQLMATITTLSDADLQKPYNHYQPDSQQDHPVVASILGNTEGHYAEHRPWIEAIVASD